MKLKDTLLMPQTSFKMKAGLSTKEQLYQQEWLEEDYYQKLMEKNSDKEEFIFVDGPPYANGDLHAGHALNKILKDFIMRYKNMNGFQGKIIWGWDTHGLPIENALLKNKKIKRSELTDAEFRTLCEEYAVKQVASQKEQFMSLGILSGEKEVYKTLDKSYEEAQIKIFSTMVEKGLIYKGLKPVYYSPSSQSALAEAEIEYHDKTSPAIHVGFEVVEGELKGTNVVIWTTTPWTIPANYGVCVNPNFDYSQLRFNNEMYLVATNLVDDFSKVLGAEKIEILKVFKGHELENIMMKHPLYERNVKIMLGEHVTEESGTGCVHTAPGHGEDDFLIGKQYGIEVISVVDAFGKMNEFAPGYEGVFYEDANKLIGEDLEKNGKLINLKFIKHSYPHDWRTKKPVMFRATNQWFASIEPVKEGMLEAINNVEFVNDWARVRLYNMIEGRNEWCISRQRKWGVPIPIFYDEKEQPIFDMKLFDHVAKLFGEFGSNIWFEKTAKELLPEGYTNENSPNGIFTKENDIMDVWFDSGSAHTAVGLNRLGKYPADIYIEGSDQYRGWFNSSLITGYICYDKSPYKKLISHGFVLDGKGIKMSKSQGNIVSPSKITKTKGADILRLWVATVDYQQDVRISDDILNQVSEVYRRYRNSVRFLLGNLFDFKKEDLVPLNKLVKYDKYVMIRLNEIISECQTYYDNYEFKRVVETINNYITIELSAFYMDYLKDVTYINNSNDIARRQVQTVLYHNLEVLLKIMMPIIPHTTYEAYNNYFEKPIFLEEYPEVFEISEDEELVTMAKNLIALKKHVNKEIEILRDEKIIGKSFEACVVLEDTQENKDLNDYFGDLSLYLIVSKVTLSSDVDTYSISKFDGEPCERCYRHFNKEELISISLEEDHTICKTCGEIINRMEKND